MATQNIADMSMRYLTLPYAAAVLLFLLVLWRLWKFTLLPILRPHDPKELPYWIPILGHGPSFFHNSAELMVKASNYFENSGKDPFALTTFGSTFYVISQPAHTSEVYKNTRSLSFEDFVQAVMKHNGLSAAGIRAAFSPLPNEKEGFPNLHSESLMSLVRRMHMHQLYPGKNLGVLETQFFDWFTQHLRLPALRREYAHCAVFESKASIHVSLLPWCSEMFTRAGEFTYFGEKMNEINPNLARTFLQFDELSWQILYQYPRFLTGELNAHRQRMINTFKEYVKVPQSQRGVHTWFMAAFEKELRMLGFNEDDVAAMLLTKYWVLSTNTRKALFWLLTYLLYNPSLMNKIRTETSSAFEGDSIADPAYLQEHCPHLDAAWYETLRMSSNSASVRPVVKDTVIGGKVMRKGSRVLVPYRLLHFDESVFGDDIHTFNPERFMSNPKALIQSASWRPFGGGKTMCTGRYVAKSAVTTFVALLLRRFDVSLVGSPVMPEGDTGRPVLGIMTPKEAQHLVVRIATRTSEL